MMTEEDEKGGEASFLYAASPSLQREQLRPSLAASVQDTRVNLLHVLDDDDERVNSGPTSPAHTAPLGPTIFVQLSASKDSACAHRVSDKSVKVGTKLFMVEDVFDCEQKGRLQTSVARPLLFDVVHGSSVTLVDLSNSNGIATVLSTVEALFASIRRNLDARGTFKPVMDRSVNRLTDDQSEMERGIRRKVVGNTIEDSLADLEQKEVPSSALVGVCPSRSFCVWSSAVELHWERETVVDLLEVNSSKRPLLRVEIDKKNNAYLANVKYVFTPGGPKDVAAVLETAMKHLIRERKRILLFSLRLVQHSQSSDAGRTVATKPGRISFLLMTSPSLLQKFLSADIQNPTANSSKFRKFMAALAQGRVHVVVDCSDLSVDCARRALEFCSESVAHGDESEFPKNFAGSRTMAVEDSGANERTVDGNDAPCGEGEPDEFDDDKGEISSVEAEVAYYKKKAWDLFRQLRAEQDRVIAIHRSEKTLRTEWNAREQQLRCEIVEELTRRFDQIEQIQGQQYQVDLDRAEDLAEERIRIWVDGTKKRYEQQIEQIERAYQERIAELDRRLAAKISEQMEISSRRRPSACQCDQLRQELEDIKQQLAEKTSECEDNQQLLEEAGQTFKQQQEIIAQLKGDRSGFIEENGASTDSRASSPTTEDYNSRGSKPRTHDSKESSPTTNDSRASSPTKNDFRVSNPTTNEKERSSSPISARGQVQRGRFQRGRFQGRARTVSSRPVSPKSKKKNFEEMFANYQKLLESPLPTSHFVKRREIKEREVDDEDFDEEDMEDDLIGKESESSELRAEIAKLKSQLDEQHQHPAAGGDGDGGGFELIELECKVADLETSLKTERERADELQHKLEDTSRRADTAEAALATVEADSSRIDGLEQEISAVNDRLKEAQKALEDERAEAAELKTSLAAATTAKDDAVANLARLEEERAAIDEKLTVANNAAAGAQEELAKVTASVEELKKTSAALKEEVETARSELEAETKKRTDMISALNSELAQKEKSVEAAEKALGETKRNLQVLEAKLQSSVDILAEKTKELDGAKKTVADLERQLTAAAAEKQAALDRVENGSKELTAKIAAFDGEKTASEKLMQELKEQIKSKEQAVADTMRQMNDVQRELVDAKTSCVELKKEKLALNDSLTEQRNTVERLKTANTDWTREKEVLVSQRNAIDLQLKQTTAMLEKERTQLANIQKENSATKQSVIQYQASAQELSSVKQKFDQVLAESKEREANYAQEKDQLGKVLQQTQTELMTINAEKKRIEQDLHLFKTREMERIKNMEGEFRKAHESLEAQLQGLRGQLKHAQEEVRIHQQKKAQVETQLEASRERESRLSSSVAESNRLKLDNEALCRDVKELRAEVEALKTAKVKLEKVLDVAKDHQEVATTAQATSSASVKPTPPKRAKKSPIDTEDARPEQSIEISRMADSKKTLVSSPKKGKKRASTDTDSAMSGADDRESEQMTEDVKQTPKTKGRPANQKKPTASTVRRTGKDKKIPESSAGHPKADPGMSATNQAIRTPIDSAVTPARKRTAAKANATAVDE
uniref:Kinesin motor domain-containing protein n=1 Tax=Plectus sambesii TaxID=2011161 RepID=A0A914W5V2_9BILA